ncbi:MAG: DUF5615 family PIN-like protein [Candidatus Hodarchaeales archaeon]
MRFLLDENVPRSIKRFLVEELKFEAITVQDLNKRSISNGDVVKTSLEIDAIVITFDKDFTILSNDLRRQSRIIYIKIHPRDPIVARKLLEKHLSQCITKLMNPGIIQLTTDGMTSVPS